MEIPWQGHNKDKPTKTPKGKFEMRGTQAQLWKSTYPIKDRSIPTQKIVNQYN